MFGEPAARRGQVTNGAQEERAGSAGRFGWFRHALTHRTERRSPGASGAHPPHCEGEQQHREPGKDRRLNGLKGPEAIGGLVIEKASVAVRLDVGIDAAFEVAGRRGGGIRVEL